MKISHLPVSLLDKRTSVSDLRWFAGRNWILAMLIIMYAQLWNTRACVVFIGLLLVAAAAFLSKPWKAKHQLNLPKTWLAYNIISSNEHLLFLQSRNEISNPKPKYLESLDFHKDTIANNFCNLSRIFKLELLFYSHPHSQWCIPLKLTHWAFKKYIYI